MGINTLTVNNRNLAEILMNNKEKNPNNSGSGIYQLKCEGCDAEYIGETGRGLHKRIKDHRMSILKN